MSIYITQLIYIKEGKEDIFDQFESIAIPAIVKYNGQILFRVRPDQKNFIESTIENPYEIHLASFPTDEDFRQFMQDEERKKFLHLKEASIQSIVLIKGGRGKVNEAGEWIDKKALEEIKAVLDTLIEEIERKKWPR